LLRPTSSPLGAVGRSLLHGGAVTLLGTLAHKDLVGPICLRVLLVLLDHGGGDSSPSQDNHHGGEQQNHPT
jgi:hypothetical protein